IEAGRTLAVADDDRDFGVRNSIGCNACGERFEIRAAAAQEHANALVHKRKTLAQSEAGTKRDGPRINEGKRIYTECAEDTESAESLRDAGFVFAGAGLAR